MVQAEAGHGRSWGHLVCSVIPHWRAGVLKDRGDGDREHCGPCGPLCRLGFH